MRRRCFSKRRHQCDRSANVANLVDSLRGDLVDGSRTEVGVQ